MDSPALPLPLFSFFSPSHHVRATNHSEDVCILSPCNQSTAQRKARGFFLSLLSRNCLFSTDVLNKPQFRLMVRIYVCLRTAQALPTSAPPFVNANAAISPARHVAICCLSSADSGTSGDSTPAFRSMWYLAPGHSSTPPKLQVPTSWLPCGRGYHRLRRITRVRANVLITANQKGAGPEHRS